MTYHLTDRRMEFDTVRVTGFDDWERRVVQRFKKNKARIADVQGFAVTKDRVFAALYPKCDIEFGRFSEEDNSGWIRVRTH